MAWDQSICMLGWAFFWHMSDSDSIPGISYIPPSLPEVNFWVHSQGYLLSITGCGPIRKKNQRTNVTNTLVYSIFFEWLGKKTEKKEKSRRHQQLVPETEKKRQMKKISLRYFRFQILKKYVLEIRTKIWQVSLTMLYCVPTICKNGFCFYHTQIHTGSKHVYVDCFNWIWYTLQMQL